MGFLEGLLAGADSHGARILAICVALVAIHLAVTAVRRLGAALVAARGLSKTRTLASLLTSALVFALYFLACGLILRELGVSLTAYLASASIVGLAIGFGSQGLVQDVVTGLTLIFSDLVDIGDMIDIAGHTGIVRSVGVRWTVIENGVGARVYVPNRTVGTVVRYPSGHVLALVDLLLPPEPDLAERIERAAAAALRDFAERMPSLFLGTPTTRPRRRLADGRALFRMELPIWPGRTAPVESTFRAELASLCRGVDPSFEDWRIAIALDARSEPAA